MGTLRRECTDHIVPLGERHLRRVLLEYVDYYDATQPPQTLARETPEDQGRCAPLDRCGGSRCSTVCMTATNAWPHDGSQYCGGTTQHAASCAG